MISLLALAGCSSGPTDSSGPRPTAGWVDLALGAFHSCALEADGAARCWGADTSGQWVDGATWWSDIEAGYAFTCGLRDDVGTLACEGAEVSTVLEPPQGEFQALLAGDSHFACAIGVDHHATCWGSDYEGEASPPATPVEAGTAGATHSCWLDSVGEITCVGADDWGQLDAPSGVFVELDAGTQFTCALATAGAAACWGRDTTTTLSPPAGAFTALECGQAFCCALEAAQELRCWGDNTWGQLDAPAGAWSRVAAGHAGRHACAIAGDHGEVRCWGDDRDGQASPGGS